METYFTKIGVRPEYLGNYTGTNYKIKLSDMYNKKKASHIECSQLFQKFIVGAICVLCSGLATNTTSGFSVDYSNPKDMSISLKIPESLLGSFSTCRYSFYLQMLVIRISKIVLNNLKNSTTDEDKTKFSNKKIKDINPDYLAYEQDIEKYFIEYDGNSSEDNDTSSGIMQQLVLFNLKRILNKDDFYRDIMIDYENEIMDYMDGIQDSEYDINFGQTSTASPSTKSTPIIIFNVKNLDY